MKFSVALPCYNEEENILQTVNDILEWASSKDFDLEVVAVNDGSQDKTEQILREIASQHGEIGVVTHEENKGYGAALVSGLDAATGDVIGFMDSDGQFKAKDFDLLLAHIDECPCVIGRRQKRADPMLRSVNALCYGLLVKIVFTLRVRDINCGMKIFRRDIWQTIRPRYATGALFNAELLYRLTQAKIRWKQINVHHYPRLFGHPTGANIGVIFRMFVDLFRLRFLYGAEKRRERQTPSA